jgi:GNAT superfamily N-acetyltransferase
LIAIECLTTNRSLLQEFIALNQRIYRHDPSWISPNRAKLFAQLSRPVPFFGRGELTHFLARINQEVVGRVSAIVNRRAVEENQQVGFLGFFECQPDHEIAEKLFASALDWLREKKISIVRGPINGSTWHTYRLLTRGFGQSTFLLEPYNPEYYQNLFVQFGFGVKKKYYSSLVSYHHRQIQSAEVRLREFEQIGYTVRPLNLANFERELKLLYELSVTIFKDNWGYTQISWEEFRELYDGLDRLVDPELVLFALDPEKKPIGFVFGIPDYGHALRVMKGENHFLAKARFMLACRRPPETMIVKTLGVLPEARRTGIGSVLVALIHQRAQQKGYTKAIHALMSEENVSRKISEKGGEAFKEYAVYEMIL